MGTRMKSFGFISLSRVFPVIEKLSRTLAAPCKYKWLCYAHRHFAQYIKKDGIVVIGIF
jgi:hypothetical protein